MKQIGLFTLLFLFMGVLHAQISSDSTICKKQTALRNLEWQDNYYDSVYMLIQQEINSAPDACEKAIWNSYMAEFLYTYYTSNQYKIISVSHTTDTHLPLSQWDVQTLVEHIIAYYHASISQPDTLLKSPAQNWQKVFSVNDLVPTRYCPTLYDILAHLALEFYSHTIYDMPIPMQEFSINHAAYFADNAEFSAYSIPAIDTLSFQYLSLQILQNMTSLYIDQASYMQIHIALLRLKYCYEHSTLPHKKQLYLQALQLLEQNYRSQAGYELICLHLGHYYNNEQNYIQAVHWYEHTIKYDSLSHAGVEASNYMHRIQQPVCNITTHACLSALENDVIQIYCHNCDSIYFRILPYNDNISYIMNKSSRKQEEIVTYLNKINPIKQWSISGHNAGDYIWQTFEDLFPALKPGKYLLYYSILPFAHTDAYSTGYTQVLTSNIQYAERQHNNTLELWIYDRKTGKPLPEAMVLISNPTTKILHADASGKVKYNSKSGKITYRVYVPHDSLPVQTRYLYNGAYTKDTPLHSASIYTDKAIYRPGQTLYFKTISLSYDTACKVNANEKCTLSLYNTNSELVSVLYGTTNEYGSFSGSFLLPEQGNTGYYSLQLTCNKHIYYKIFRVEEYVKPRFESQINAPEQNFRLGDSIVMKGTCTAYAGYAVDKATVKYHITCRSGKYNKWWFVPMQTKEIAHGEMLTNENGEFYIRFIAEGDTSGKYTSYEYTVSADITDISGETHSCRTLINVSKTAMNICLDMPDIINKTTASPSFSLTCKNLAGIPQQADVHYKIYQLEIPKRLLHSHNTSNFTHYMDSATFVKAVPYLAYKNENEPANWNIVKQVSNGTVSTHDTSVLSINNINHWNAGYYKIILNTTDLFGQKVETEHIFIVQSEQNTFTPYQAIDIQLNKNIAYTGDTIRVDLSSYIDNAYVLYEVMYNNNIIDCQIVKLNKNHKSFYYVPSSSQTGTWHICAHVSEHNRAYSSEKTISIQKDNMELKFKYLSFRNMLLPGQKEQWSIQILNSKGLPVQAEMLCNMYDASLDAFSNNTFTFNIPQRYDKHDLYWNIRNNYTTTSFTAYASYYNNYTYIPYPHWNINIYAQRGMHNRIMYAKQATTAMAAGKNSSVTDLACNDAIEEIADEESASIENEGNTAEIRSNFEETAFFIPHLHTNEEGIVNFSALMPESLTKWKMQGIAHTTGGYNGYFEQYIHTQKPLMVVPNYPRFFREGDTIMFTAKIVNMHHDPLNGQVKLELKNAETGESLNYIILQQNNLFYIEKGNSATAVFTLVIPKQVSMITCTINANSSSYSDGEQKNIPVLTNRILVTETLPMYVNGHQTKTYTFDKLQQACLNMQSARNTLAHHRLTFEYTSSPAWYALQSLPYLMEYPYECNEQIFSRLYANAIAHKIVNSSPDIKQVIHTWLHTDTNALLSALENNAELKNIALEETPWLLDAKNEKADKQKLALLCQDSKMNTSMANAKKKLENAQNYDGGWSWFKGGKYSSMYITGTIVSGVGHLQTMDINPSMSHQCIQKAISYMDKYIKEWYDTLHVHNELNRNNLSYMVIHYLYARSYFIHSYPISSTYNTAYQYCLNQAKKYGNQLNLYGQTIIALSLYRNNIMADAKKIMTSIRSKAQYSDEMGMWWRKEGYGWNWYEAPIERQAIMIEAFETILQDHESVSKMQLWLLKQKQTQHWSTTRSTAEACYALLMRGDNLLMQNGSTRISVGNESILTDTLQQAQAGTGYFKLAWSQSDITADKASFTLQKQGEGSSWGAAYWQYFENMDKITYAKTPLAISKQIYTVKYNNKGEVLEAVNDNNTIHVGDKLRVRVVIQSDRDMQYLHMKDMRASALEPVDVLSGYKYQNGLIYYQSTRDASTNFFIEYLPKGTYVFEYTLTAVQKGAFSNGITTIECMYAPEFTSHSNGIRINIE